MTQEAAPASASPPVPAIAGDSVSAAGPVPSGVDVFAGVGLGLFLGTIAGLSVSPVVQAILGALVTVLTGFLSVQATGPRSGASALRIGCFGFASVVGLLFGLYVRTANPFESIDQRVKDWTRADYSKEQAKAFVAFERLGFKPKDQEVVGAENTVKEHSTAIFAAVVADNDCADLDPDNFRNDATRMIQEYQRHAGWKVLAEKAQAAGAGAAPILEAAYHLACKKTESEK